MNINKLIEKIKQFEPKFFFEWLSIISIHPSNQKYLIRIEFIFSVLFSIKEDEFLRNKSNRSDILRFFKEISSDFNDQFFQLEDYTPFDQNKLIPLFINGDKYYFSYGLIENPYTRIKVLSNIIFDFNKEISSDLKELKDLFILSLKTQTRILSEIIKDKESNKTINGVYIPTQIYFDSYIENFKIKDEKIKKTCRLGFLQNKQALLLDLCINFQIPNIFTLPFVVLDDEQYIIFPHFHIEYFGYRLKYIVNKNENYLKIWEGIELDFKNRLENLCLSFFSYDTQVFEIYTNKESNENLIEKYNIASCYLIDQNKLLFFKTINHKENKSYSNTNETYKIAQQEISKLIQEINENDEIGFGLISYEHIFGIKTNDLEIWNILVLENISLEMDSYFLDGKSENSHFVEIGDLAFVFEKFLENRNNALLHFVKFIQNDRDFLNSSNPIITTNYLDRVVMYLSGNNYYFKFGKNPDFLNIAPYQGNEYESEYYYNKYKDDIYEIIEKKFPDKFNIIEKIENRHYRVVDITSMHLLYILKIPNYIIYIYPPLEITKLPEHDKELLTLMLPQLFCFYIDKFANEFINILRESKILPSEFSLLITSNSALKTKENKLPYLISLTDRIVGLPFIIETKRLMDGSVRSYIIANTGEIELLINLFKPEDNSAERYCIMYLINSILKFDKKQSLEVISREFIDKYIPNGKKSFSFNIFKTENPKLDKYSSFIKINLSDIGKVNKLFAEHLVKINIKPGIYIGDKSKEINGIIFNYLQNLLEENIIKFSSNILMFSYLQLEFIEGKSAMNKIKNGMNTNREIRYNLKEKVKKDTASLIKQSAYSKHIIQTILKVNPNGEKVITNTDWTYLIGIVAVLMETSHIYEYINYDLSPHKLIISDLYEITTEKISDKIDHKKWEDEFINHQIENSKYSYLKASEIPFQKEESVDVNLVMNQFKVLDSTYKNELGYSIRNQLDILYALYRSYFKSKYFPLSIVTMEEIIEYINKVFPEIEEKEIIQVIDNLSLSFETYEIKDKLIPTELLRSKKRLNVCPIIKITKNKYLFGNQLCGFSSKLWWSEILDGDFPYQIKNIKISEQLDEIHKINSKQLEKNASEMLRQTLNSEYVILNLKKFNIISSDLPKFPACGEIDILCVNSLNKIIYIFEAKSILQHNRPYSINQVFKDFFGTKGKRYYEKLNMKYDFVKENIEKFVKYFNLEYNNDWKIQKAFVVDKKIFASYHTEYNVDIMLIEELEKYVNALA